MIKKIKKYPNSIQVFQNISLRQMTNYPCAVSGYIFLSDIHTKTFKTKPNPIQFQTYLSPLFVYKKCTHSRQRTVS